MKTTDKHDWIILSPEGERIELKSLRKFAFERFDYVKAQRFVNSFYAIKRGRKSDPINRMGYELIKSPNLKYRYKIGKKFRYLEIVKGHKIDKCGNYMYRCKCIFCGKERFLYAWQIRTKTFGKCLSPNCKNKRTNKRTQKYKEHENYVLLSPEGEKIKFNNLQAYAYTNFAEEEAKSFINGIADIKRGRKKKHKDWLLVKWSDLNYLYEPGDRIENLTITGNKKVDSRGNNKYEVKCDCGKVLYVHTHRLTIGDCKSCGCGKFKTRNKKEKK
ncbi:MAG: hypothetical protein JSU85_01105 [Candidatus Zixiibacteriota bacterium]|nr:MAG: hypothetical protein JSU85_01105 [candidate division Zixibacteria bacterium]